MFIDLLNCLSKFLLHSDTIKSFGWIKFPGAVIKLRKLVA